MLMIEFNTGNNTYEEGGYILLYHKYYTEDDPQQLTPKELQTLIILKDQITSYKKIVYTTYNLMGHLLPFANHKLDRRNANTAKEVLQALKDKQVIQYDEPKDIHSPIVIKIEEVKYDESDKRTGYQTIPFEFIEQTNDPYELYVLVVVRRFNLMDKEGEYNYPYFRNKKKWGSLLGCDDRTAYNIIERMIKKQLLYWYENDKSYEDGKWNQFDGKYFIYPQEKEEERIRLRNEKRKGYKKVR
jgi:hypothetical protein